MGPDVHHALEAGIDALGAPPGGHSTAGQSDGLTDRAPVLKAVPKRSGRSRAGSCHPGANHRIESNGGNQAGPFGAVGTDGSAVESAVTITLSTRLHRSLGRCRPAQGLITLRPDLASSFDAVLCHEAAHVAAFVLHGRTVRPHGAEWASLVAAVGFDPVVRTRMAGARPRPIRPLGYRFEQIGRAHV